MKPTLLERPKSVEELKEMMQERFKPRLDGDVTLHYEDPDFDGDLCLLVDIQELPEKGTLRVVRPEGYKVASYRNNLAKAGVAEVAINTGRLSRKNPNNDHPNQNIKKARKAEVFAEFQRINNVILCNQFYKERDRHTPKLIRDKATKTGKIVEEMAKLMRIYDIQSAAGPNLTDTPVALLTVVTDDSTDAAQVFVFVSMFI
ncbi:hypothetical protein DPEC_G00157680 [Dallia pectoralis]|uniref:Uncharacterized protein n=1 Tax=Dallia pectoralis TaxID=75939 RepID=A0ACC2GLG2_DALPE|nr:hypothetical protein DPEC_G00157680 [Dallia pectoralis]